jgi:hypothetical protein
MLVPRRNRRTAMQEKPSNTVEAI